MNPSTNLEEAILFATYAHQGQKHATGTPYILHPLRVMNRVWAEGGNEEQMIIAVLHDTIEDTKATFDDIHRVAGLSVACSVNLLTRGAASCYEEYIGCIAVHEGIVGSNARLVKLADLADNLELGRTHPLTKARQFKLTSRYLKAQTYLRGVK